MVGNAALPRKPSVFLEEFKTRCHFCWIIEVGTEHGTDFMSAAREVNYQGNFLIVAGVPDVMKSALSLRVGASGIFLKSGLAEFLLRAIKVVVGWWSLGRSKDNSTSRGPINRSVPCLRRGRQRNAWRASRMSASAMCSARHRGGPVQSEDWR